MYDTLNRIIMEDDIDALHFAMKKNLFIVEKTILDRSIQNNDLTLAHFFLEFDRNNYKISEFDKIISNYKFVKYCLRIQQIDVNKALVLASENGYYEVVKLLLTVPEIYGNTITSYNKTLYQALQCALLGGHIEVVKLLLTVPEIDVNAKTSYNRTALIWASMGGHIEVVKLLLTFPGIDANAKDIWGDTALIWASGKGYHEVVKILLTFPGIDVNAKNVYNNTALIWASREGHHEVVKLLLTFPGIYVNAKNVYNNTALILASDNGHHEVVKLIIFKLEKLYGPKSIFCVAIIVILCVSYKFFK